MRLGDADAHFESPGELVIPALDKPFDDAYESALYEEHVKDTPSSRRIARALDWLGIAWRNTSAIEIGTRVVALRAGFEVLLGVGDSTRQFGSRSANFSTPTEQLELTALGRSVARPGPIAMIDLGWWFQSFSLLRNSIMHGDEVAMHSWQHGEHNHVWVAEDRLRRAIKETLIRAGHSENLRHDPARRELARRVTQS
ncbi:MAG TPA: hypothetical protein VK781_10075 [Solirubrobacteraceae bacterium]|nr:hypothetical protein [Solirubrobacteraceae bacterium]